MGIGESILKSSLNVKRKLFDRDVQSKGRSLQVVKLSYEENIFGDRDYAPLEARNISAIIRFPDQLPLDRYRVDGSSRVEESRTYFFDILPIEAYFRLTDYIEKGDMIFFRLGDEQNNTLPFLLQVTETFGKFDYGLVWKMMYLSPVQTEIPEQIRQYLSDCGVSI